MALERNTPNVEYIQEVLHQLKMKPRELSKLVYGADTHRDIIKEVTTKPDVRASTVLRICRALGISMDSLYENSDNVSGRKPLISGIANVTNSTNVRIEIADLKAENKALKLLIEEKEKRINEQLRHINDLSNHLATLYQLRQNKDTAK